VAGLGALVTSAVVPCRAQDAEAWSGIAAALAVSALTDQRLSVFARSHHDHALDELARASGTVGEARYLVPALAASFVVTRLAAPRAISDAALRIGLSYAAADGVESILKPVIGRHRPTDGRGPWRFQSFRNDEQWHSFPSAHVVHLFSLARALALETDQRWVAIPAYGVATLVGVQRVYTGAHWGSDVVASTVLAIGVATITDETLRRRGLTRVVRPVAVRTVRQRTVTPADDEGNEPRLRIQLAPRGVALSWTF
jgi:membrane-associated phospholipid phosphatase